MKILPEIIAEIENYCTMTTSLRLAIPLRFPVYCRLQRLSKSSKPFRKSHRGR